MLQSERALGGHLLLLVFCDITISQDTTNLKKL